MICDCIRAESIGFDSLERNHKQPPSTRLLSHTLDSSFCDLHPRPRHEHGVHDHDHPVQAGLLQESTTPGSWFCYQTYCPDSLRCRCRGYSRSVASGYFQMSPNTSSLPHPRQREEARLRTQEHARHFSRCHRLSCARRRGCKGRSCHLFDSIYLPHNGHQVGHTKQEERCYDKLCVARYAGAGEGG